MKYKVKITTILEYDDSAVEEVEKLKNDILCGKTQREMNRHNGIKAKFTFEILRK